MCGKIRERARRSRSLPMVFRLDIGLKFAGSDFGKPGFFNSKDTCIGALFENDPEQIHKLCKSTFFKEPAERSVLRLTGTMILITNIDQYKLHCLNGTTEFNASCNYCVISALCECALQTDEILLPALLSDCDPSTEIENKFLVNLKVFYAFFNESKLLSFDGGSLLNHPINISLPIFNFHQSNETYLHEQVVKINMERLSEEIKKDKQIYYSHESEMQYRLTEIQAPILFDFANWKDVTLLVSGILIIIISMITMYLLCKISRLAVVLNFNTCCGGNRERLPLIFPYIRRTERHP